MFYIAEGDGKVHGTHPKLKKHTQIIYFSSMECQGSRDPIDASASSLGEVLLFILFRCQRQRYEQEEKFYNK